MTHLVQISKVRDYYQLRDDDGINVPLAIAGDMASLYLENALQTDFSQGTVTDEFAASRGDYVLNGGTVALKLSNGFLTGVPTSIKVASFYEDLDTTRELDTSGMKVDLEKGIVTFMGTSYKDFLSLLGGRDVFVRVVYDKGFATANYAGGKYYTGAPEWLTSLATFLSKDYKYCGEEQSFPVETRVMMSNVLTRHLRYAPHAIPAV